MYDRYRDTRGRTLGRRVGRPSALHLLVAIAAAPTDVGGFAAAQAVVGTEIAGAYLANRARLRGQVR
ncbi:MAG TPA: hypothetical protein VF054_06815 [Micromonosporaceae bacterium]